MRRQRVPDLRHMCGIAAANALHYPQQGHAALECCHSTLTCTTLRVEEEARRARRSKKGKNGANAQQRVKAQCAAEQEALKRRNTTPDPLGAPQEEARRVAELENALAEVDARRRAMQSELEESRRRAAKLRGRSPPPPVSAKRARA